MKILSTILLLLTFMGIKAQIPDVNFMEYTYQNNTCNGFKYGSGSLIFIPANAFVMEDGSECKGAIKVKYRELHSQTDMVVSGLNMLLKRNGKDHILESAGMFEIRVECNGKPMKMTDGVSIQVRMNCRRNLPNLEAFIYDEKQSRWTDYGKVYDFSYDQKNPKKDDALWGSNDVPSGRGDSIEQELIDPETGEPYVVTMESMYGFDDKQMPDGFFKGMNINQLGIFNYDGVLDNKDAVQMIPEFVVNTGEPISDRIFVAYAKKNTVVYYYPGDFPEKFVLLNTKGIKMFTKLKDGSYATLKEGSLDKSNIKLMKGTKQKFILEKQPIKPKTKEELASVAKINNK
ncbi:MAG: hypothetical protein Q8M29_12425 [Bacteroidota bacterium]|nr:hypothetical protein [Bacteroidota bacterium]